MYGAFPARTQNLWHKDARTRESCTRPIIIKHEFIPGINQSAVIVVDLYEKLDVD